MNRSSIAALAGIVLSAWLGACTPLSYYGLQNLSLADCEKYSDMNDRQRCRAERSMSLEQYEDERAKAQKR